jgi:hypothetical protein
MNVSHFSDEELQATLNQAAGLMDVGALTPFEHAIADECCRACVSEMSRRNSPAKLPPQHKAD